jgi:hypothetical protein
MIPRARAQFSPAVFEALVRLYDRGELPGMEDKAPGEGASRAASPPTSFLTGVPPCG